MTYAPGTSTRVTGIVSPSVRYTKAIRQRIIREFAEQNGGVFDAKLFESEVRDAGPMHEAWDWFTWDETEAALQHRIYQAREFAIGLKIVFTVEELVRNKKLTVIEREMPFVLSPLDGRSNGGGYYLTDPSNEEHTKELCRQAASSLRTWRARYLVAASYVGMETALDKLLAALETI